MGDKVYVLGGAQTDFERNWSKEGKNVIALLKEVVSDALSEVKLTYELFHSPCLSTLSIPVWAPERKTS